MLLSSAPVQGLVWSRLSTFAGGSFKPLGIGCLAALQSRVWVAVGLSFVLLGEGRWQEGAGCCTSGMGYTCRVQSKCPELFSF